jgi:hypothetical protein
MEYRLSERDGMLRCYPARHVTFRLLAPKVNAVDVVIGITSGPYEPQGTKTTAMTKDANAYLQAAYTQPEWAEAFVPDPSSKKRKLIPCA